MTKNDHAQPPQAILPLKVQSTISFAAQKFSESTAPIKQIQKPHWTRTNYFEARQKKLVAQAPRPVTSLLTRLHIYFTGVRSHSQRRLETIVWRNGGTVHKNCLRTIITHIIADNLCASKIEKEISPKSRWSGVIVRPQWLLSSVQTQKLLPTWEFQLIKNPSNVKKIDTFFRGKKSNRESNNSANKKSCQALQSHV